MRFGDILALIQGWSKQGWKYVLFRLSRKWNVKVDLVTHLGDNHVHLFLWYLMLFWSLFKVGETKVQNMHFCQLSLNFLLKVDFDIHLRDKHWHVFLLNLELFWPSFKVFQVRVENMHFSNFLVIVFGKWI